VLLRDFTAEEMAKDREKAKQGDLGTPDNIPGITQVRQGKKAAARSGAPPSIDATAQNPTMDVSPAARNIEPLNPIQMFELEPGVPDPLAMNAYQEATAAQRQRAAAEAKKRVEKEAAELVAKASSAMAATTATGGQDADTGNDATDENARFKAEVEKAIKEQLAKERLEKLSAPVAGAPSSIAEMLGSLGLEKYQAAFDDEGMELPVLVQLARAEDGGKEALDEALKEIGVKSVGHRLKIFAALQGK